MWNDYQRQIRLIEEVICEELLCITESPPSRRTAQNEEFYWNNVLQVPTMTDDNLTTRSDVLDDLKTLRSVPLDVSFRLVDLTSPEVVQFRNKIRPQSIPSPVLDSTKDVSFEHVVDLFSYGPSLHVLQYSEPILEQYAFQETKLTLKPYLALKDGVSIDDSGNNLYPPSISTCMAAIQTTDQLTSEPYAIGKLLFDDVRSPSLSFMDTPFIYDPFSCHRSGDIHSVLFLELAKNRAIKPIEFEDQSECKEDQLFSYLRNCLELQEVPIDDAYDGESDSIFTELISVVSENTNNILISPSDFVPENLELDDVINEFEEDDLVPKDLTADSFLDLLSKRLELNCSNLTLSPVRVPSLEQVLCHEMDGPVPKEQLQPCPTSDSIFTWNITNQDFSPLLSEESEVDKMTSTAKDAMISLFKGRALLGSSKQRLWIQNSKFPVGQNNHSLRLEQERPIKRLEVKAPTNMEFFMKLKSSSANKPSLQRGPSNRLQVTVHEVEPSSLVKRTLKVLAVKYQNVLNSLPLNLKQRWNGVKRLDPPLQVSSNDEPSSANANCPIKVLLLLRQISVAVLDNGPVATNNQFIQVDKLHS